MSSAAALKAWATRRARSAAGISRPEPVIDAGRRGSYARLSTASLMTLVLEEQKILDVQACNPVVAGFARYNDSLGYVVAGQSLGGAIATRQYAFTIARLDAIERVLISRDVDVSDIIAARFPTFGVDEVPF